ncbi:HDA1 complex subunit [Hirsutella rhossiliensis]|uniref:HDA1 complex subunit n=1 Tax=Hirsutella rhossiliensis TaxID=111463 RepID=A0A9P8N1E1_9HYPO|nr:HDA1 complex subunit [Hirsutella rhossiliensis]KAH0965110.1 HDA1 complex subunit [Hirsutella rhossiliensis]
MPKSRRKRTRTPKAASPDEGWYSIKDILDERKASGLVEYLVDWENNIVTGESYAPTWVLSPEVTDKAKEEWEKAKAARAREKKTLVASAETSQESQPPRPPNRPNVERANARSLVHPRPSATPSSERPKKKSRLAYSATPSEEPVPSVTSTASPDSEAFDSSARQDASDARRAQRLVVELPKDAQFDPSDFVSAAGTQPSLDSSQSLAELEDGDERLALASQISRRTVPDSQEPSGPTWSQGQASGLVTTPGDLGPHMQQSDATGTLESQPSQIPSRQPEQSASPGGQRQHLGAAAISKSLLDTSDSSYHPPIPHAFNLPESSLHSQASASSSHALIPATATDKSQPSTDSCPQAERVGALSQDAQVVSRDEFVSQVNAFSRSDSTVQESPEKSDPSVTSSGQPNKTNSRSSPQKPPATKGMNAAEAGNSTPPGRRMLAAEELSQLFDLDNSMDMSEPDPTASLLEQRLDMPLGSVHPASATQPRPSSVQSLQKLVDAAFSNPIGAPSGTLMPSDASHAQQPTVSPADVSKQTEAEKAALTSMPSLPSQGLVTPSLLDSSRDSLQAAQALREESSSETSSDVAPHFGQMEHVVTLPFQASLRPYYDDTLLKSRQDVTEFSQIFNNEIYVAPNEALVSRIDQLFGRLSNVCDYPPDVVGTVLADLPPSQLAKYACNSNSKFNFVFELLQGLYKDTKILIVARSVELLRLLDHLAEAAHVECTCEAIGKRTSSYSKSAAQVTLTLPGEDVKVLDFDVVIGFDRSFATSRVFSGLRSVTKTADAKRPRLLTLVTTHSIEHIDLHVPDDMSHLERKSALLLGIARARKLVSDPERGYPEPHELAGVFVDYLNGKSDAIISEPVPLPDEVLDIYLGTQSQPQMPLVSLTEPDGRKRKLDEDSDDHVKKTRVLPPRELAVEETEPPVPDDVQAMLKGVGAAKMPTKPGQTHVRVPLAVLQALAEKFAEHEHQIAAKDTEAEYRAVISGLEKRVEEYERTTNMIYKSHRKALEDRSRFEAEKRKSEAALQAAAESAQKESDKAQKKIVEFEAEVARLTADPNGQEESPLAQTNKHLKETRERVQMLEKRLENAHKDGEYVRKLYQEASSSAGAARAENAELKDQNQRWRKETSDGLVKIHQIQAENSTREFIQQIRELKAQAKERELELDRVREDLRQLRNGRRETRQVSVPRSPRTGMMSPRTGRAYGSSASRGTSPALASSSDGAALPSGNGRWAHLRD